MFLLFFKGFLIGLSIAAPVGPIGVLCINRTLSYGRLVGFMTGLGAALADGIYGCLVGFGLVAVSQFLLSQQTMIQLLGGGLLLFLGLKTFFAKAQTQGVGDSARTLWQDFFSTLILTLMNPATILSFIAIYASLGIVEPDADFIEAFIIIGGVFLGSLAWWLGLSSGISLIRHKLTERAIKGINHLSGIILMGFGGFAAIQGLIALIY